MAYIPYCGSAPVPGHLAWNLDPVVIACLIAAAMVYAFRSKTAGPLIAGAVTVLQMSLLGALLTFARLPLFGVHATTTWAWGLSPLEDQELGGLIMWIPGGILLTLYGVIAFGLWMYRMSLSEAS